ncbi:MAG TPA: hypothetical protein VKQ27_20880 [Acetobacteraceae bacterium]|nr:hypothetical protein [Acetobacteraceae bacterium]
MPVIASAEDVRATRRRASSNGTGFWLTSYIGANRYSRGAEEPPGPGTIYPMAFLVEQDPDAVVGAHYHQADQFQVMVDGTGRLGTHAVAGGAVHFAGAWTAYGPLAAGQGGLHYFTLRNGWDPGARYMEFPDNRATLRSLPRQHREAVGEVTATSDGLAARRHQLDAGASVTGPDPIESGGQFWLVLAGSMQRDGGALPPRSCIFIYPHEPAFTAISGPEGLTVLMLQFPKA